MDEKWFAITLLHITAWDFFYCDSNLVDEKYHSTSKIELKELLKFLKQQQWSIKDIDNKYIEKVDESYVYIKESLIIDFISEIEYQEKFLQRYALKSFKESNINVNYLFIENEITGKIIKELTQYDILEKDNKLYIKNLSKDLIFELDFKNYIEEYVQIIDGETYYIFTDKLLKDFDSFLKLNNNNHNITQDELNELITKSPLLLEVKKQSKIRFKENNKVLTSIQQELIKDWFSLKNFNELKNQLMKEIIQKLSNNGLFYSIKDECNNWFKVGKNHIGLNVFIKNEDDLKHIASDDVNFEKQFKKYFNVKDFKEYNKEYDSYDKNKDYIFFEIKSFLDLTLKDKKIINQILSQGRSHRNFIWFNLKESEIAYLKKSPLVWNVMSCYFDKENISKDLKKEVHPQLWKVIKKVFINSHQYEFLIN